MRPLAWTVLMTMALALAAGCGGEQEPVSAVETDLEYRKADELGLQAWRQGLPAQAAQHYARALARARAMDAPPKIADAAYNLAAANVALGQLEAAADLLREARREADAGSSADADIILLQARTQALLNNADAADALARDLLGAGGASDAHRAQAYVLLADLALQAGQTGQARDHLQRARSAAANTPAPVRASVAAMQAKILAAEGSPLAAAQAADDEADLYQFAGEYRRMADALATAARLYEQAGRPALAAERYFRAARSVQALEDRAEAARLADLAAAQARQAGDEALLERIGGLQARPEAQP